MKTEASRIDNRHNQKIGKWGEEFASKWLTERGFEVIARNVRTPHGEIDIVAKKEDLLILIEVKTRTSDSMGLPEISVSPRKQQHMSAAAAYYAAEQEYNHWQIDVIAITGKPGRRVEVHHFENVL